MTAEILRIGGAPSAEPKVKFAVIADPQRPLREPMWELQLAIESINGLSPDFTVLLGDLVDEPDGEVGLHQWDRLTRLLARLDGPVYCAIGNHDASSVGPDYSRKWREVTGMTATHYTFEAKGLLFAVLDTLRFRNGTPTHEGALEGEQLAWLRGLLHQERSPACVFSHNPLIGPQEFAALSDASPLDLDTSTTVITNLCGHLHRRGTFLAPGIACHALASMSFNFDRPSWPRWYVVEV